MFSDLYELARLDMVDLQYIIISNNQPQVFTLILKYVAWAI